MTTIEQGQRLRRKIMRCARRASGKRVFATKLKLEILVWVNHMKAEGATEAHCGRLLGLTPCYFTAWRHAKLDDATPTEFPLVMRVEPLTRELVPIEVPPSIELTAGVVLVTPKGYRVEGLNLEQAFALLQEFV